MAREGWAGARRWLRKAWAGPESHNGDSSMGLGRRPGGAQRLHDGSGALGGGPGRCQSYATALGSQQARLHIVAGGSGAAWRGRTHEVVLRVAGQCACDKLCCTT